MLSRTASVPSLDAICLVESPLQVLNALEARARFGSAPERTWLLLLDNPKWSSQRGLTQTSRAASLEPWARFDTVSMAPATGRLAGLEWYLHVRRWSGRATHQFRDVDTVFVGNYESPAMLHVANVLRPRRVVILDDGTQSVRIGHERRAGLAIRALRQPGRRAVYRLLGLDIAPYLSLVFFSAYDIQPGADDDLVPCTYDHLRSRLCRHDVSDHAVFLGNPVVEDGDMTIETYVTHLRQVVASLGPHPVVYRSHRREQTSKLERLARDVGVPIHEPDDVIEVDLLSGAERASIIASFYSSALLTCGRLLQEPARVVCFRLPERAIVESRRHLVDAVYAAITADPYVLVRDLPASTGAGPTH